MRQATALALLSLTADRGLHASYCAPRARFPSRCHSPLLCASNNRRAAKRLSIKAPTPEIEKDKHLLFDEAEVVARAGPGGNGAVLTLPSRGEGPKLKRTADSDFELPPGGGHGGDVILFVDPGVSDLLHLRGRPVLTAPRGGDSLGLRDLPTARQRWREIVDGSDGGADSDAAPSLSSIKLRNGEHLRVPVPAGTFVRTKGGRVLGDLVRPGQELRVACGGEGGPCMLSEERRKLHKPNGNGGRRRRAAADEEEEAFALTDAELQDLTLGSSAEEAVLTLVMRTVADVGFVGFPNAGENWAGRELGWAGLGWAGLG